MALLATARYLSNEQLARAMFAGREEATRKRLVTLSGSGGTGDVPAYLRRIFFRTFEGNRVAVWALADAGYSIAERVLGHVKRPQGEVGVGFLEHTIALNELLIRLLAARLPARQGERQSPKSPARVSAPVFPRITAQPFRWLASDCVRLPWREYEPAEQAVRQRVIQPDAVLEFPSLSRRIFIECEMGTHSVVAESDEKSGATIAKVDRYEAFLTGLSEVRTKLTFYAQAYPDGFSAELLFLVMSESRANTIKTAVANWRKGGPNRNTAIRAQTVDLAAAEILRALGAPNIVPRDCAPSPRIASPHATLRAEELEALKRFYVATYGRFKTMRDEARAQRAPVPEYPSGINDVAEMLTRLGALKPKSP